MDIEMLERIVEGLKDEVRELRKIVESLVPQLPWQDAPDWARWAAKDIGDDWYWYECEPDLDSGGRWYADGGSMAVFTYTTHVDYKYSKQCRP